MQAGQQSVRGERTTIVSSGARRPPRPATWFAPARAIGPTAVTTPAGEHPLRYSYILLSVNAAPARAQRRRPAGRRPRGVGDRGGDERLRRREPGAAALRPARARADRGGPGGRGRDGGERRLPTTTRPASAAVRRRGARRAADALSAARRSRRRPARGRPPPSEHVSRDWAAPS